MKNLYLLQMIPMVGLLGCTPNNLLVGEWELSAYGEDSNGEPYPLPTRFPRWAQYNQDADPPTSTLESGAFTISSDAEDTATMSLSIQVPDHGMMQADIQLELNVLSPFQYEFASISIGFDQNSDINEYWQNVFEDHPT